MKKKVLIVENDKDIRDIVGFILENEGYDVSGCAYTFENLNTMHADLILMDEWINLKQGHMLCKEIKIIERFAHVPVIIFSTSTDIVEIAAACKADGYVRKPFDVETLVAEVRRFLPLKNIYANS